MKIALEYEDEEMHLIDQTSTWHMVGSLYF